MTELRIIRADERRRMPWKNGGGETFEIAVEPSSADLSDFDWRVSAARVASGGAFSSFPNVDRTLCLLEGTGMELVIDDRPPIEISPASEPHPFPADVPTFARLTGGPIEDLNVMTRRGCFIHSVERIELTTPYEISARADLTIVVCGQEPVEEAGSQLALSGNDTLLCAGPHELRLRSTSAVATVFLIRIARTLGAAGPTEERTE